jgi:hypothetical protein
MNVMTMLLALVFRWPDLSGSISGNSGASSPWLPPAQTGDHNYFGYLPSSAWFAFRGR